MSFLTFTISIVEDESFIVTTFEFVCVYCKHRYFYLSRHRNTNTIDTDLDSNLHNFLHFRAVSLWSTPTCNTRHFHCTAKIHSGLLILQTRTTLKSGFCLELLNISQGFHSAGSESAATLLPTFVHPTLDLSFKA